MTDTAAPITEPHLAPMFATGGQPTLTPNTEPHPCPIFDTGPHPEPLRAYESVEKAGPVDSGDAGAAGDSGDVDAPPSERLEYERAPRWDAGFPESTPELAKIARGLDAAADIDIDIDIDLEPRVPPPTTARAFSELENIDTDAFRRSVTGHLDPVAVSPVQPAVVPGAYLFVKRWKFALITAGVWLLAAAAGGGFYYWWYTALDKTLPVFGILLYLATCVVASLLVSLVPNRPQVTALAVAVMSAPLASTAAAAVLHGAYFFEWIVRPTSG